MRLLSHRHIFSEIAQDVFRNNRRSSELISGNGARECCLLEYVHQEAQPLLI